MVTSLELTSQSKVAFNPPKPWLLFVLFSWWILASTWVISYYLFVLVVNGSQKFCSPNPLSPSNDGTWLQASDAEACGPPVGLVWRLTMSASRLHRPKVWWRPFLRQSRLNFKDLNVKRWLGELLQNVGTCLLPMLKYMFVCCDQLPPPILLQRWKSGERWRECICLVRSLEAAAKLEAAWDKLLFWILKAFSAAGFCLNEGLMFSTFLVMHSTRLAAGRVKARRFTAMEKRALQDRCLVALASRSIIGSSQMA